MFLNLFNTVYSLCYTEINLTYIDCDHLTTKYSQLLLKCINSDILNDNVHSKQTIEERINLVKYTM